MSKDFGAARALRRRSEAGSCRVAEKRRIGRREPRRPGLSRACARRKRGPRRPVRCRIRGGKSPACASARARNIFAPRLWVFPRGPGCPPRKNAASFAEVNAPPPLGEAFPCETKRTTSPRGGYWEGPPCHFVHPRHNREGYRTESGAITFAFHRRIRLMLSADGVLPITEGV